jgi:hypothetical protein
MKKTFATIYLLSVFITTAFSQTSPITYGAVSRADLQTELYPAEKGAEAVVLCDYATAKLTDDFQIEFTRHVRIKIFKSTGLDQANIQIVYTKYDKLSGLKAATYNLADEKITTDEVATKEFYMEKVSSYRYSTRFSFPNVREGSVIEFIYTLTQDEIRSFRAFRFQRMIPVRHVEYNATIPGFLTYVINLNHNNMIQQQHSTLNGYYNSTQIPFEQYRWIGNNLAPFEPEPLMPESDEYLAGVDFVLAKIKMPNGGYFEESPTYQQLYDKLLINSDHLSQINNTLLFSAKVKELTAGKTASIEKAQAIYNYVQKHMKWNGYEELLPEESFTKAHREKTGSNAVINLLLVNMLRTAGITADPLVLSTRENGVLNPVIALATELNYVVCIATIEGKDYLMDATDKFMPMGELPFKCLNGEGWILSPNRGRWVKLLDKEKRAIQEYYDLTLNEAGELTGHAEVSFSGYDALEIRELVHNQGEIGFRDEMLSEYGDLTVSNLKFYALDSLQAPLGISFDIKFKHNIQVADKMLFFKPLISLFGRYRNIWIKDERRFPIDVGCPLVSNFSCIIHLPASVKAEELPKALRINMPENDARFLFGITPAMDGISILANLDLKKTFFTTSEYSAVREFYTQVNKKCSEMIILKKTNDK